MAFAECELFGNWYSADILANIYSEAERIAGASGTTADEVFAKASFNPVAYQRNLSGQGSYVAGRCEEYVIDRLKKCNTLKGGLMRMLALEVEDPVNAYGFFESSGLCEVSDEEYARLEEKAEPLMAGMEEWDGGGSGSWRRAGKYAKAGAAVFSLVLFGAAAAVASTAAQQASSLTAAAEKTNRIKSFNEKVRRCSSDSILTYSEISSLNAEAEAALDSVGDYDTGSMRIDDPMNTTRMGSVINAYASNYGVGSADHDAMRQITLMPQHHDAVLGWFNATDRSAFDYETRTAIELLEDRTMAAIGGGPMTLYDAVVLRDFLQRYAPATEAGIKDSMRANISRMKLLHNATKRDVDYVESLAMKTNSNTQSEDFSTPGAVNDYYADMLPRTKQVSGGLTTKTVEIPPEERYVHYYNDVQLSDWGLAIPVVSTALAMMPWYLFTSREDDEHMQFLWALNLLSNLVVSGYNYFGTEGTVFDYYKALALHASPVAINTLAAIRSRISSYLRSRHEGFCNDVRRMRF